MKNDDYHYEKIAKAIQFLKENQKKQPSLEEIAKYVNLSKFHFQRLFRQWAGVSPKDFLQYLTIEEAKNSLKKGKSTLESAYEVGLSGNGRLHDLFLKIEACTPGEFKNRGNGLFIKWDSMDTPFGRTIIAETKRGICKLSFGDNIEDLLSDLKSEYPKALFQKELGLNAILVKTYFDNWTIPKNKIGLDLKGTPFQVQVWKALLQIPSAQLVSYKDIAHKINRPNATRAIGTAISKNPIAYLIPCHRVIKANGEFGQYHWGHNRKTNIIGFEKANLN